MSEGHGLVCDLITKRRLLVARQLFQEGVLHNERRTRASTLLALIAFDLASETVLHTIATALDPKKTPADAFAPLLAQCNALVTKQVRKSLPDVANVRQVHLLRNDAQHRAKHPLPTDVDEARIYTRDFLQKTCMLIWNLDFNTLTLADLVQEPKSRELLQEAEDHLRQGRYRDAVDAAAHGLEWLLMHAKREIVGVLPHARGLALLDSRGHPVSSTDCQRGFDAFVRMHRAILFLSCGMNPIDYEQVREITGAVAITAGGTMHVANGQASPTEGEANMVVTFAIDAVLQIEEREPRALKRAATAVGVHKTPRKRTPRKPQ